jgi:hypothetical protein
MPYLRYGSKADGTFNMLYIQQKAAAGGTWPPEALVDALIWAASNKNLGYSFR